MALPGVHTGSKRPIEPRTRGERPGDELPIERVLSGAFPGGGEANLVARLRNSGRFDAELSRIAEGDGRIIGHALGTPGTIRLGGRHVPAMLVGPVAVAPQWQSRGVGTSLVVDLHQAARRRGLGIAMLLGHDSYYPRFGYRPRFGFASITFDSAAMPAAPGEPYAASPVEDADLPWLKACAEREWDGIDFSWVREPILSDWRDNVAVATVWRDRDGRPVGYTVRSPGEASSGRGFAELLGDDPDLLRNLIRQLRPARLDMHPAGWLAQVVLAAGFAAGWATGTLSRSSAAMAAELTTGALAAADDRPLGSCNWPIEFLTI